MRRRTEKSQNASYVHPFINGSQFLFGVGEKPRTLCELAMTRFSAEMRSRPDWWKHYKDPQTRKLWFNEAVNKTWKVGPKANNIEAGLAKHQIEYVLDELAGYAALRDDVNGMQVSCFDRIWQSIGLISDVDRASLVRQLDALRSSTKSASNILVDPFLHCYRHGRSHLRRPEELESFIHLLDPASTSTNYATLPSLVEVHQNPSRINYRSYINGIDPALSDVYSSLQKTLERSVTLFEKTLTTLHRSNPLPQRIQGTYRYRVWDEPDPPEDSDDEEAWEVHSRELRQWALYRPIEIPDVPDDGYRDSLRLAHEIHFRENQSIQIIHRITDIQLDRDRPNIADTKWHVEGMANEQISVCCLHFLAVEGIDTTQIAFRMAITSPTDFLPHDVGATLRTWGLQSGDECNQDIGSVPLRNGLAIAFPNFYQHCIRGIQLRNGCEKGRITVLELYLVDPDVPPIVSTADVAPQQRDWILRALADSVDRRLPQEVLEKIVDMVEGVFSDEEAEKYRAEITQEREVFRTVNDRNYFCLPFSVDVVAQP
ncbi:uncharacterized protein FOMMEDRAFT_77890 [Fomitiporia mediterranea MF3/22]|uniref:uncharacterized protein n=1 Tax=Fomitiporia mediterranea (strain MF3/22) TaxID=694068 RepID=UPI0004408120|nr:uncharacterized protein FOMMEDRAFT_77890 [Fomitiporia mediterranea MF3/22]EJD05709.1 hypothetical protein FOMMEDRAFT_77890 [Fomitiporia mediterranea MF3/22]